MANLAKNNKELGKALAFESAREESERIERALTKQVGEIRTNIARLTNTIEIAKKLKSLYIEQLDAIPLGHFTVEGERITYTSEALETQTRAVLGK